jgi:predicted PurR-regulated permease PerM
VPFYGLYWLYRVHGEVAAVAPSRGLLSPRAALLGSTFVPFLAFFAMASLVDALNSRCQELGRPRLRSPVTTFLWALFLAPVAVALIQSSINRWLREQPSQPAA